VAGIPETPEERRRRQQQTRFGVGGDTTRQQRLTEGERTLGGGLYVPPNERGPTRREVEPQRLNPPGPRVVEYTEHGREVSGTAVVPPPPVRTEHYEPQQTLGPRPVVGAPAPPTYTVRAIPADITANWRAPFVLRQNQLDAVRAFHERHKGTVVFPTGVGKTDIAAAVINDLRIPTVAVVPTLVLVDQWRSMLLKWGIRAGVWTGAEKSPNYVTISTYQSLFQDPSLIRRFPLLVYDEAHLATAEEFRALIYEISLHPYALALTATTPTDTQRRDFLSRYLPTIASLTPGEAIERGYLSPVRVIPEPSPLSGTEQQDYDKLSRTLASTSRQLGTGNPQRVAKMINSVQFSGPARAYLKALSARRLLLSNVKSKQAILLRLVRANPRQRVLLFSESVPALESSCDYLRTNGIGCHIVTGQTEERDRRFILENWGKTFFVLGSIRVLELGFNTPEAGVAIFLASGSGRLKLTQRLGRILRVAPGKTEAVAYVVYATDTVETRVARSLQQLAGQQVTVDLPTDLEDYDEG